MIANAISTAIFLLSVILSDSTNIKEGAKVMRKKILCFVSVFLLLLPLFVFQSSAATPRTNWFFNSFSNTTESYIKKNDNTEYSIGSVIVSQNTVQLNRNQAIPSATYVELFMKIGSGDGLIMGNASEVITLNFNGKSTVPVSGGTLDIYAVVNAGGTIYDVELLKGAASSIYQNGFNITKQLGFAQGPVKLFGFKFILHFSASSPGFASWTITRTNGWFESSASDEVKAIQEQTAAIVQAQEDQTSKLMQQQAENTSKTIAAIEGSITPERASEENKAKNELASAAAGMETSKMTPEELASLANPLEMVNTSATLRLTDSISGIYDNPIVLTFITLSFAVALMSYIFFGKKDG